MKNSDKIDLIRDIENIVFRISENMQLPTFKVHELLIPELFITQHEDEDNLIDIDKTIARIDDAINDNEIEILKNVLFVKRTEKEAIITEELLRFYSVQIMALSVDRISFCEYLEEREATKVDELNKIAAEVHREAVNMGYVEEDKETTLKFYTADNYEFEKAFFDKVDKECKVIEKLVRAVNKIIKFFELTGITDDHKESEDSLIDQQQQKIIDYFVKEGWIDANGWTNPKTGKQYKYKWIKIPRKRTMGQATHFLDAVFKTNASKVNDKYFGVNALSSNRTSFTKQGTYLKYEASVNEMINKALQPTT